VKGEKQMKVIYREDKEFSKDNGFPQCPYLTDGKTYEVEDTITIDGEQFYMIDDDESETSGDAEPYLAELFEVVEG
jgi:hypothetical protein